MSFTVLIPDILLAAGRHLFFLCYKSSVVGNNSHFLIQSVKKQVKYNFLAIDHLHCLLNCSSVIYAVALI